MCEWRNSGSSTPPSSGFRSSHGWNREMTFCANRLHDCTSGLETPVPINILTAYREFQYFTNVINNLNLSVDLEKNSESVIKTELNTSSNILDRTKIIMNSVRTPFAFQSNKRYLRQRGRHQIRHMHHFQTFCESH